MASCFMFRPERGARLIHQRRGSQYRRCRSENIFLQSVARHALPALRADISRDEGRGRQRQVSVFDRPEELRRLVRRPLFGHPRPSRRRQYEQLRRKQRDAPLGNAGRQSQDRRDHYREPPRSPARGSRVAARNWLDPRSERGVGEQHREDPHVYVWAMDNPMVPVLKQTLTLKSGRGSHWLTFDVTGDHGYVAPGKGSTDGTEIFDLRTHASLGVIGSSEDMIAIEFMDGKISRLGDQYGIGRR